MKKLFRYLETNLNLTFFNPFQEINPLDWWFSQSYNLRKALYKELGQEVLLAIEKDVLLYVKGAHNVVAFCNILQQARKDFGLESCIPYDIIAEVTRTGEVSRLKPYVVDSIETKYDCIELVDSKLKYNGKIHA